MAAPTSPSRDACLGAELRAAVLIGAAGRKAHAGACCHMLDTHRP